MKIKYFFKALGRTFDFKGVATRAEFFTYAVPSFLLALEVSSAFLLHPILASLNLEGIIPPEMLNETGKLESQPNIGLTIWTYLGVLTLTQLPMFSLSVRRLRDQAAGRSAYPWVFVPLIGAVVMLFRGFAPTIDTRPAR